MEYEIKKLGFGLMRLPQKDGDIDRPQVYKMVDDFMSRGFTYFDTAYVYMGGRSEKVVKDAIVERYPRESFTIATKLPIWAVKEKEDMERIFEEQLERTGAGYFDFYLLHAMDDGRIAEYDKVGAWEFMRRKKEEGKIRKMGFSFHDKAEVLDKLLTLHPEAEFVQLQINYKDWDDESVQSRKCYEVARKHNKPVIVMEPVKGGSLAVMPDEIQEIFKANNPELSIPSWAVRFAASLDGVLTVLSGMSTIGQLEDNVSYMDDFKPFDEAEMAVVAKAVEKLNAIETIPCTACKYCVDDCPMKINIPGIFSAVNHYRLYNNFDAAKRQYERATKEGGRASNCIKCCSCEGHCPQHIAITEELEAAAKVFE